MRFDGPRQETATPEGFLHVDLSEGIAMHGKSIHI